MQDTYLRAFRSFRRFSPGTSCRAWLFTILRNVFLNRRRRAAREVLDAEMTILDEIGMTCTEFETQLHPYGDGELPVGDTGAADAHLAACPACADQGERKGFRTVAWVEGTSLFGLVSSLDYQALLERADRLREARARQTRV